jgi:hypothetical protein
MVGLIGGAEEPMQQFEVASQLSVAQNWRRRQSRRCAIRVS